MSHLDTYVKYELTCQFVFHTLEYGLSSRARQTTYVPDAYAPGKRRAEPAGPAVRSGEAGTSPTYQMPLHESILRQMTHRNGITQDSPLFYEESYSPFGIRSGKTRTYSKEPSDEQPKLGSYLPNHT